MALDRAADTKPLLQIWGCNE